MRWHTLLFNVFAMRDIIYMFTLSPEEAITAKPLGKYVNKNWPTLLLRVGVELFINYLDIL